MTSGRNTAGTLEQVFSLSSQQFGVTLYTTVISRKLTLSSASSHSYLTIDYFISQTPSVSLSRTSHIISTLSVIKAND
jgi:hypothetical protein